VKKLCLVCISSILFGCAQGRVAILDGNDNVVGYCSAAFDYHLHGVQDSVNYILQLCAKEQIEKGYRISDESILANDYTFPVAPNGEAWNTKLAKNQFSKGFLTEEKLGYILAHIEYEYQLKIKAAKESLDRSEITRLEYESLVADAKQEFEGT